MRLSALELENWAVHEKLQLKADRSLQIEGRNGTGKSSILEAIRFVFSKDGRSYKRFIKNGARSCRVVLKFSDKGSEYSVEKSLHLKTPSEAKLIAGTRLIASNPTEVHARLQDILPENILEKLLYVPQDGLVELIENLRIKGGRQELDALLGLDRFERIYVAASSELKEKEARSQEVADRLKKHDSDTEAKCREGISKLMRADEGLLQELEKDAAAEKSVDSAIAGIDTDLSELKAKKKQRDAAEKRCGELRLLQAEEAKELEGLDEDIRLLTGKKDRLKDLGGKESDLRKYLLLKEPLTQLTKEEERLRELSDTKKKSDELSVLEKDLKALPALREKESAIEAGISEREKKGAAAGSLLQEKKEYLRSLEGLDGSAKCPKCGQNLTPAHLSKEHKAAKAEEAKLMKAAAEVKEEIDILKSSLKDIKKESERLRRVEVDAECIRNELTEAAKEKAKVEEKIRALKEKLKHLGYGGESEKMVEEKVGLLNKTQGEIAGLEKELRGEEGILKKRARTAERLRQTAADLKETEEKTKEFVCDESLLDNLQKEKDRLQKGVYELRNRIDRHVREREYNQRERDALKARMDEFLDLSKRAEELKKDENLLREALEVFHTNKGIVKYLRERYISQLSGRMSHYFKRINQNPKYREIAFDKDYNIEVTTTEGSFSIDQLSGGEKVQLAIALRIAMIRMLSPINLLILDEPFGSLDAEHREVLGEALNKIALDGQLILVTHIGVESLNLPEKLSLGGY